MKILRKEVFKLIASDEEDIKELLEYIELNTPDKNKYIKILKDSYGIEYGKHTDPDKVLIEKANLNDIKTQNEFSKYSNYVKYAQRLFKLRKIKYKENINLMIDPKLVQKLVKPLGIKVKFSPTLSFFKAHAYPSKKIIEFGSEVDFVWVESLIHELGHILYYEDPKIAGHIAAHPTYSITKYGLKNNKESFSDNFAVYFTQPKILKKYVPEVFVNLWEIIKKYTQWKKVILNIMKHSYILKQ